MDSSYVRVLTVMWIVMAWGAGCCPESSYELIASDPTVRLPLDEAPHCFGGEWWYYTGRLTTDQGRGFGIEAVIFHFRSMPLLGMTELWAAHYAVLDEATGAFTYGQGRWRRNLKLFQLADKGFHLDTDLIHMNGLDGRDHLRATMSDGRMALDVHLVDQGGPILHENTGYIDYGKAGHSFYYSRPRMQASGTLMVDGQLQQVAGSLWFDRQWGRDLTDPCLQWDWFSLRLDDDSSVMLFVFHDTGEPVTMGTYIPAEGEPIGLTSNDFTISPTTYWQSPHTLNIYPIRWEIRIPPRNLTLAVLSVAADQEVDARRSTLNVYWEGLCTVSGTCGDRQISGDAYVELTNYPPTGSICMTADAVSR